MTSASLRTHRYCTRLLHYRAFLLYFFFCITLCLCGSIVSGAVNEGGVCPAEWDAAAAFSSSRLSSWSAAPRGRCGWWSMHAAAAASYTHTEAMMHSRASRNFPFIGRHAPTWHTDRPAAACATVRLWSTFPAASRLFTLHSSLCSHWDNNLNRAVSNDWAQLKWANFDLFYCIELT
jgi:hypothetical protein